MFRSSGRGTHRKFKNRARKTARLNVSNPKRGGIRL